LLVVGVVIVEPLLPDRVLFALRMPLLNRPLIDCSGVLRQASILLVIKTNSEVLVRQKM
jgi:hypothetical protein